jgi:hypothetical protein
VGFLKQKKCRALGGGCVVMFWSYLTAIVNALLVNAIYAIRLSVVLLLPPCCLVRPKPNIKYSVFYAYTFRRVKPILAPQHPDLNQNHAQGPALDPGFDWWWGGWGGGLASGMNKNPCVLQQTVALYGMPGAVLRSHFLLGGIGTRHRLFQSHHNRSWR